jgi:hypothetical protein
MADAPPPYWVLISVLFSSQPLTPALAQRLYQTAYELYRRDEGAAALTGEMARGRVVNLRKNVLLGTIGGPAFEAEIETERGSGVVRFLLTQQGIELTAQAQPRSAMN